jgi:caa(3)-type oxidase subunit IV
MSDTTQGNPYRIYFVTWFILLVITVAMLAAEKFHMPRWFLVSFLIVFMMVKAVMISGNFMHLKYESRTLAFIVGAGLIVTSLILFLFITPESRYVQRNRLKNESAPVESKPAAEPHY